MNDKKRDFFISEGIASGPLPDMENKWLRGKVTPYVGSTPDMWKKYLISQGYSGSLPDMMNKFLIAGGW